MLTLLGSFLRKNQRALKLNSLTLLDTLVNNYSVFIDSQLLKGAIYEIPPLLCEADLHVAQLSLVLLTSTAKFQSQALVGAHTAFLPEVMTLVRSPLLQGTALNCTLNLFQVLVQAQLPGLGYRQLLEMLMYPALHQQTKNQRAPKFNYICILFLFSPSNLSTIEALPTTIIGCFGASSEEVKGAASHSLGAVAVGNLNYYLPYILSEIEAQPKRQYLLLHSLKELITSLSQSPKGLQELLPSVPSIWDQLFRHCECSEEGSRNVVAECLGKLVLVDPEVLLPRLKEALGSQSALMRTAVVSAIKFTISDHPQPIDVLLRQCIGRFLLSLQDPEPSVRRVALVAFNSAVHNKPSLVRDLLPDLLPHLYSETKVKVGVIGIRDVFR